MRFSCILTLFDTYTVAIYINNSILHEELETSLGVDLD